MVWDFIFMLSVYYGDEVALQGDGRREYERQILPLQFQYSYVVQMRVIFQELVITF